MATTFNSTTVAPFGAITVHRVISALLGMVATVEVWDQKRRTFNALRVLTAQQLDDIGLTRGDVASFSRWDI